eukprot:998341-Amphidinium_carterae.1
MSSAEPSNLLVSCLAALNAHHVLAGAKTRSRSVVSAVGSSPQVFQKYPIIIIPFFVRRHVE